MTRRLPLLLLAVLLAVVLAAADLLAARPVAAAAPARLFVTATEFHLRLSRPSVAAGPLIVQMRNQGQDLHDVQLRRLDARGRPTGPVRRMRTLAPGALGELAVPVRRGTYRLTCTVAGHARMGMTAVLRVR